MIYKKLKECCRVIAGQSPKSEHYNTNGIGIPFFQGKSDFGKLYPNVRIYCSQPIKIAEKNDILLSVRAPVGPTNLSPGKVCIGRGLAAIRPSDELTTEYLLYYFRFFEAQLQQKGTGTTFKAITQDVIKNLEVPVPPIEEQQRIVTRIEELFSELDSAVETLQKTRQQLEVYRQAVLKEAFDGTLNKFTPQGNGFIGEYIYPPRYGTSKKCGYLIESESVPVYRIPNIDYNNGCINHDDIKYASFNDRELDGLKLESGDILIIRSNGSVSLVGRAAMVQENDTSGTFAGYLMRLRIVDKTVMNPQFLLWFLKSHEARIYIENKAKSTSGVHNINSKEILDLCIPIFTYHEQCRIIEEIESRISICDSIEKTVNESLQQAEAMRQSILKKAFEGNL